MKIYTQEYKENLVKEMLRAIGEDPNRPGLKDTPKRVVKMWKELFRGYNDEPPKITDFDNGNDGIDNDELICDTGKFYSHCEHHTVVFAGRYFFAYLPNPKGKVLGLSKVARVVDHFSAKLQVQERLVSEIVNYIWKQLTTKDGIEPLAMGLTMDGEHFCKSMRGVKKEGKMRTTKLRGKFKTNKSLKDEFKDWVKANV